jgi:hypothetical protein
MRAAEADVARQKAQAGYAAVVFEGSLHQCYCLLSAAKEGLAAAAGAPDGSCASSSWWQIAAAAAGWLADICSRAQQCISCKVRGPALKQAEDVFLRVLQAPPLVPQLCHCLADAATAAAGTAAAAAADAVVDAIAAMVHASANNSNAASVADHFPLAQMLTAKLTATADHGVDGDTSLLEVCKVQHRVNALGDESRLELRHARLVAVYASLQPHPLHSTPHGIARALSQHQLM